MAQANELTCRQAQKLMHQLLDRRWTKPIPPALHCHFENCEGCVSWLALFDYEPTPLPTGPSRGFSKRIVNLLQREKTVKHRPFRAWLVASAAAAALLVVMLGSYFFLPSTTSGFRLPLVQRDVSDLVPVLLTMKQEIEQVPVRIQSFRPLSLDLLPTFPEVEWQVPSDPLNGTMPSVKALGTTLQAAVEPIETPAREAYQKVKMIIHDPNVKKWLDSVTNGSM